MSNKEDNDLKKKKNEKKLEKLREDYRKKAENHPGLKKTLYSDPLVNSIKIMVVLLLINVITFFIGHIYLILIIINVVSVFAFAFCLSGNPYIEVLLRYEKVGFNTDEAEEDYKKSKVYNCVSISEKLLIDRQTASFIPINDIVWTYTLYDIIKNKIHGITVFTEKKYYVMVFLENKKIYRIPADEACSRLIMDDIVKFGNNVTEGYSDEINNLYYSSPIEFRDKNKSGFDISPEPIHAETKIG